MQRSCFKMIRDMKGQVAKAIAEIEMRYTKGIEFALEDLLAVQACMGEYLYRDFYNSVKREVETKRIASFYTNRNGVRLYKKM